MFRLLGGGAMGDMGKPLGPARLAVLPASSHTAVINQPDRLLAFIEPFLKGETPKGMFDTSAGGDSAGERRGSFDHDISAFMSESEAAEYYPCIQKAMITFIGEHLGAPTGRVQ